MTDDITMQNVNYWRQMPLSSADCVLGMAPQSSEVHKSQFRNLAFDLSGPVPTAFARTLTQQRFDLSVVRCDPLKIDTFAGHLDWLKESSGRDGLSYQVGYTRDKTRHFNAARLVYVAVEFNGQKIEDYVLE